MNKKWCVAAAMIVLVSSGTAFAAGPGRRGAGERDKRDARTAEPRGASAAKRPAADGGRPSEQAGGRVWTWQSRYRIVPQSRPHPDIQTPKAFPLQQNSKTITGVNRGEHRFYDPRTGREGAKLPQAEPAPRGRDGRPGPVQFRLRS